MNTFPKGEPQRFQVGDLVLMFHSRTEYRVTNVETNGFYFITVEGRKCPSTGLPMSQYARDCQLLPAIETYRADRRELIAKLATIDTRLKELGEP